MAKTEEPLHKLYPINSFMELELALGDDRGETEKVSGVVYCTDEICNTVVLRKSLVHTTLSNEVRFVNAAWVTDRQIVLKTGEDGTAEGDGGPPSAADLELMNQALPPPPTRKALEEREKRALKMAEENLKHVNDSASPVGQATFDRLLKACNDVSWVDGVSILVLGHIRVDPPYGSAHCKLIKIAKTEKERGLAHGSLERVKKIVAHSG